MKLRYKFTRSSCLLSEGSYSKEFTPEEQAEAILRKLPNLDSGQARRLTNGIYVLVPLDGAWYLDHSNGVLMEVTEPDDVLVL